MRPGGNSVTEQLSSIVMAAGQGTRMKSDLPKVLHPLLGRTLLNHSMQAVMALNPDQMVVVVRHDRDRVAAEALSVYPPVTIAHQDEIPGTGRAVQCALMDAARQGKPLTGTVLVTNADVPLLTTETLRELLERHRDSGVDVTAVSAVVPDATGYGRMIREGGPDGPLLEVVEHRDATPDQRNIREINAGIYAFDAEFLARALREIGSDNDQGEVYLTDTIALAATQGRGANAFVLEDVWQAEGCNDRAQLSDLRAELLSRICRTHQLAGVSIVDPRTTSIDVQVQLGRDSIVEPFTVLAGQTVVEEGACVGSGSTVINSRIGCGAVLQNVYVQDSVVDHGVVLEPYVVLRSAQIAASEGNAS